MAVIRDRNCVFQHIGSFWHSRSSWHHMESSASYTGGSRSAIALTSLAYRCGNSSIERSWSTIPHMLADYLAGTRATAVLHVPPAQSTTSSGSFAHLESSAAAGNDPNAPPRAAHWAAEKIWAKPPACHVSASRSSRARLKCMCISSTQGIPTQHPSQRGHMYPQTPHGPTAGRGSLTAWPPVCGTCQSGENGYRGMPHPGMTNGVADPRMQRQYPGYPVHMQPPASAATAFTSTFALQQLPVACLRLGCIYWTCAHHQLNAGYSSCSFVLSTCIRT